MFYIPPCKIIIIFCNFFLLGYLLVLLIDHYNNSHYLLSWASIFHTLSILWLLMRGVFWIFTITSSSTWDIFLFYILYWMPNPIEFCTFMLVPLYYTQVVFPNEWHKYWIKYRVIYVMSMGMLILLPTCWAFISAYEESTHDECIKSYNGFKETSSNQNCYQTEFSNDIFRVITALSFFILAAIQTLYAFKIHYLDIKQIERYMLSSKKIIDIVNLILIFSFLSRSIYQLGAIFDIYILSNVELSSFKDVDVSILLCCIVWDYLPTFLLVYTITSRAIGNNTYYSNSIVYSSMWSLMSSTGSLNSRNRSGDRTSNKKYKTLIMNDMNRKSIYGSMQPIHEVDESLIASSESIDITYDNLESKKYGIEIKRDKTIEINDNNSFGNSDIIQNEFENEEFDPCSLERFQAPSLSILYGSFPKHSSPPIVDMNVSFNSKDSLLVERASSIRSASPNQVVSDNITQISSLSRILNYYRRKRGNSLGGDGGNDSIIHNSTVRSTNVIQSGTSSSVPFQDTIYSSSSAASTIIPVQIQQVSSLPIESIRDIPQETLKDYHISVNQVVPNDNSLGSISYDPAIYETISNLRIKSDHPVPTGNDSSRTPERQQDYRKRMYRIP